MTRPTINILLQRRSPSAVAGFVIPVVVDAIDTHAVPTLPHVGKEIGKGAPSLAYRYTAPSPIEKFDVFRIGAALEHVRPSMILGRLSLLCGVAVSHFQFRSPVPSKTPATFGVASSECVAAHDLGCSAIASAQPQTTSMERVSACSFEDGKSAKLLINHCNKQYNSFAGGA